MSIDRIGKGGGGLPTSGIDISAPRGATSVGPAAGEFKVEKGGATEGVAPVPLEKLRSGEISMSQYLDIKVGEATSHLEHKVSTEQLAFIRDNLRQQLSNDPVLVDMVKSATGALPPPSE